MATMLRHLCLPSTAALSPEPFPSTHRSSNSVSLLSLPLSSSSPSFSSLSHRIHSRTRKQANSFLAFSSPAVKTPQLDSVPVQDAAEQPVEEFSTTRLIAQNLPWTCTAEDVRSLFQKYGTVVEAELSMYNKTKNRGLAFVEMGSPEEAAEALKNLELSEYEGRTLRVNYAKIPKEKPPPPPKPNTFTTFNLFVANLPYQARDRDLKAFFGSEYSSLATTEIVFHVHEKPRKSSGYGFVAFKSRKEAEAALTAFQAKEFMGRPIRIAKSKQFVKVQDKNSLQKKDTSTEDEEGTSTEDEEGTSNVEEATSNLEEATVGTS